jgi:List-Bact-rpt repeat protein
VQLGVSPTTGHRFIAFSGAVSGAITPQTVTMSGPLGVSAAFTAPVTILGASAQPDGVPIRTPTTVTITVRLTDINTVIPGSINLISSNATGIPLQILGQLQPVSSQPDGSYGDFATTITVNESTAKALYFEVSAAARGSLLRVVSTPLKVDVFDVPSAAQLQQISSAQSQAAAMFVQLNASLGTSQAAQHVLSFVQGQQGVKDAQLSPDAMDVWIDYTDGSSGIISAAELFAPPSGPNQAQALSRPSALQALASPASEPMLSRPSAFQALASSASGTTLSPNSKALILAPFNGEFTPHDVAADLRTTFTSLSNQGIAAQPDFYAGTSSTVGRMKTLAGYGVFVINTHGGSSPNGPYIDTGEPMSSSQDLIAYREDLLRGRIVRTSQGTYGITRDFIYYYYPNANSLANNIVLLSACVSAGAATLDTRLAEAFINRGAAEVYAYRFAVTPMFTEQVGTQLFSILADSAQPVSQRTASAAFGSVSSLHDGFTGGFAVADAGPQDISIPLNIGLTITPPQGGTITSSTGSINCGTKGTACQANIPPGTTVLLTATSDPGFQLSQWLGAACINGGVASISVTVSQSTTCTASFLTAFNVVLSPSGSYNIAEAGGPYEVQLVDQSGAPISTAPPQQITITLNKQITSGCRTLRFPNTTVTISGGPTGSLGFVAALDQCGGKFYDTTTSWKISSAVMGSTPIVAVSGKDFLAITRTISPPGPLGPLSVQIGVDVSPVEKDTLTYHPPTVTSSVSVAGGNYQWSTDNPGVLSIVGPSSGPNLSSISVAINGVGKATLQLNYTVNGTTATDMVTFALSKDVAVVGWIDGTPISASIPSGVSPDLVSSLGDSPIGQCPATLIGWTRAGQSGGVPSLPLPLTTLFPQLNPIFDVTNAVDRTYANNILIKYSANNDPGDQIDSLFPGDSTRYRAYLRFQAAYLIKNGAIVGTPKTLIAQTAAGNTLDPCYGLNNIPPQIIAIVPYLPSPVPQLHHSNGAFGVGSGGTTVYLLNEARVGPAGQAGDTYLNDRGGVVGATTPWIWTFLQFGLDGNYTINHQIFPTYSVYEFSYPAGPGVRILPNSTQAPLQTFIDLDSSSQFIP